MDGSSVVDERYPRLTDVPGGSPEPVPGKCGAKRSQGPGFCLRDPMANGSGRCPKHGGRALRGAESGTFVHGRYSRHVPVRLLERLETARQDPELLSLRAEIELTDARVAELLERVQSGESAMAWKHVARHWKDFRRFKAAGNTARQDEALEELSDALERGLRDQHAWDEIGGHLDRRQRLVEAQQKHLERTQATLTVEEAMGLLGTVLDVLRRHVIDPDVLDAIGADLEQLVTLDAVPLAARSRRQRR